MKDPTHIVLTSTHTMSSLFVVTDVADGVRLSSMQQRIQQHPGTLGVVLTYSRSTATGCTVSSVDTGVGQNKSTSEASPTVPVVYDSLLVTFRVHPPHPAQPDRIMYFISSSSPGFRHPPLTPTRTAGFLAKEWAVAQCLRWPVDLDDRP